MTDGASISLRDFDRPADRIRQHRQVSDHPVLVVEGPDDALVLKHLLPNVEIFPVNGKSNVLDTARTLLSWDFEAFVCITDNDFDDPRESDDIAPIHHPYEQRDLESMLIQLGALAQMIEHLGSAEKIESHGGIDNVVKMILVEVAPVTNLRKENAARKLGLAFDGVDLSSKVDKLSLKLKVSNYCAALAQVSLNRLKATELTKIAEVAFDDDLGHRGKDVILFTGVALRRKIGSQSQAVCVEDILSSHLRSGGGLALSRSTWLADLVAKLRSQRRAAVVSVDS